MQTKIERIEKVIWNIAKLYVSGTVEKMMRTKRYMKMKDLQDRIDATRDMKKLDSYLEEYAKTILADKYEHSVMYS
jgi:hypothetical protein